MATKKTMPMACVTIGFESYLMPTDVGMKVVQLMQESVRCDRDYTGGLGHVYTPRDVPTIELTMVRPNQVRIAPQGGEPDFDSADGVVVPPRLTQRRLLK